MIYPRLLSKYDIPSAAYYGALLIVLSLAPGCGSSRSAQESAAPQSLLWQQTPLLIDGSSQDWPKPMAWYDPKEQLAWTVSNDRDNIYIMLTTKSQLEQQKIIGGGLTVWINPVAEKSDNGAMGIAFPTDSRNSRDKSLMQAARPDLYKNKPASLDDLTDYSLFGFTKDEAIETYPVGQPNKEGVQVKINFNGAGELIYEAAIPIGAIFPAGGSPIAMRKSIGIGFVMEGLPPQPGTRGGGGGPAIGVGGGIGMGSFGSGVGLGLSFGGGGRNGNRDQPQLYKQTKIWQVLPLARPAPVPRSHT